MSIGKLFCLEGTEGAGKTTLLRSLKGHLDKNRFAFMREPGGTPFGEDLRKVIFAHPDITPETQLLLFMASRIHIFESEIRPRLLDGIHVITDRMDASTFAYQVFGQNGGIEVVFNELRRVYLAPVGKGDWLKPFYIFLNITPEDGLARVTGRTGNSYDKKPIEYHRRVYEGYKHFIPTQNHVVIDATLSAEKVLQGVLEVIHSQI